MTDQNSYRYLRATLAACTLLLTLALSLSAQVENEAAQDLSVDSIQQKSIHSATTLVVSDYQYDDGERLDLSWVPSIDDIPTIGLVTGYQLYRSSGGEFELVAELTPGANSYENRDLDDELSYSYYLVTLSDNGSSESIKTEAMQPQVEWLNLGLANLFLIAFIFSTAVIYFIQVAKSGKKMFIRKIAGLEAVDEAIGRATEMGRPILYIPGIHDMDDVQTLASLTILGHVARKVADYDIKINMPVARSLVMTAARETIKASYMSAGRPDGYSDDMVNYITDEQFGYVAAVDGIMVREKPATIFLLGAFFAESLILAETGNYVGAIQIAGTARPAQLPFFIAACDFTLIGEELFAASAYLSGEPRQLGSLKGQDVGKAIAMVVIVIGVISATFSTAWDIEFMTTIWQVLQNLFSQATG